MRATEAVTGSLPGMRRAPSGTGREAGVGHGPEPEGDKDGVVRPGPGPHHSSTAGSHNES